MRRLLDLLYAPISILVLSLLLSLVCVAVIAGPNLAIRRETARFGVRLMLACIGVPMRIRGRAGLPYGANIVVCNHASYFDGMILMAALPRCYSFVVQDGAAGWPLIGASLRRLQVIFVNRSDPRAGARATRAMMRQLADQQPLAIFAEGTFVAEPGLLGFKAGAFLVAARCGVPVVPVAIRGSRRLYGGGRWLPRWSALDVEIGTPIAPLGKDRAAALQLRDAARGAVLRLCGEPDHPGIATDAEGMP